MIIGITGKLGSGKTYISKLLVKNVKNSIYIDVDKMEKIEDIVNENKSKIIILDGKNLTNYLDLCNIKILVDAKKEDRLNRIMRRDSITEEEFYKIDIYTYNIEDFDYYVLNTKKNNVKRLVKTICYNL